MDADGNIAVLTRDYGYSLVYSDMDKVVNRLSKYIPTGNNNERSANSDETVELFANGGRQPPPLPPPKPQLVHVASLYAPEEKTGRKEPADANASASATATASTRNIYYPESVLPEVKPWDVFRLLPRAGDDLRLKFCLDVSLQCLKALVYVLAFALLLGSAVVAKGAILLMTSGIGGGNKNFTLCNNTNIFGAHSNSTIVVENSHVVKWVWSLYLCVCMPEVFCLVRSLHRVFFRNVKRPSIGQFFVVFVVESLHATGIGLLLFKVLPGLDAITGAMLSSCLCIVPAILTLLSRKPGRLTVVLVVLDLACIAAQSSGFWAWPIFVPGLNADVWAVPLAILLTSLGWWENFVHQDSLFPFVKRMARFSQNLRAVRSKTYALISVWKCLIYLACLCAFVTMRMRVDELMQKDPFGAKPIKVVVWRQSHKVQQELVGNLTASDLSFLAPVTVAPPVSAGKSMGADGSPTVIDASEYVQTAEENVRRRRDVYADRLADRAVKIYYTTPNDALWLAVVQILAAFSCYQCAKFACKVMMQRFAFAAPVNLSVPLLVVVLLSFCTGRSQNKCFLTETLPYELFWQCGNARGVADFFSAPQTWFWFLWLFSQIWVTIHIWMPKCERLADTDRLFVLPWISGAFIDQSLSLNRRRDDKAKIKTEEVDLECDDGTTSNLYETIQNISKTPPSIYSENGKGASMARSSDPSHTADAITKIYACATMWHETTTEMICMLKSIFRLDEDQCARRNAQKYLKVIDPDYYEFEAHILFDDAFEQNDFGEPIINRFVKQLLTVVEQAAGAVHQTLIRVKPPKKYVTPYGGRLVWTLPGHNRMIVHLKDKTKIRVRKRWSQVMYMYYLMGHRLMEKIDDVRRKETIAENAYILTLDGDVDFQPKAVHLLVDLMKKNRRLGAACGRMHPRGAGPMVWYQKFEYAIGHWFQKATEHMIGCVLCAPGCFSLFRSAALMDDNILRRYATKSDKARDYIQFDQGEDRWLCTLLLQRGYRVEYCAASDALTYAPEGFDEFFNQRRRWIPSTVANILDLLSSYRKVVRVNDSISIWYVLYQFAMLVSSILGPGTIFLMVVGAVNISFGWETYQSLLLVMFPVVVFGVTCLMCKSETQLIIAQIISSLFAMLMMAVIVGTALQVQKDGIYSPHAIFLVGIIISFFIAAILHPLEFSCIIPGILYFLAIPCMYMLLIIYSVCNLHVVSWGTREVKGADGKGADGEKGKKVNLVEANDDSASSELDGVYSFGCGSACRLMCCLQPSAIGNSPQMIRITQQLENMTKKLEKLDTKLNAPINRRSSLGIGGQSEKLWENQHLLLEEDEPVDDNFDAPYQVDEREKSQQSEAWLGDTSLRQAEHDHLEREEDKFWKELIDKYLYPLSMDKKHQDQIASDLVELRNKCAGGFFLMNALFILIVFLLQLQKNCLHIEWPIGPLVNRSVVPCDYERRHESIWLMSRLQLEPIGVVFLVFFVSLLLLQFVAMLMHRFGTLSHILASTELFCFRKSLDKLTADELVVQNAVEIVRELQAIKGIDEENAWENRDEEPGISRRRVVKSLESSRKSMMKKRTETLDAAFKKRFFALNSEQAEDDSPVLARARSSSRRRLTLSKGTIRALEKRRNSVFGTLDNEAENPYAVKTGNGQHRRRAESLFRTGRNCSSSETDDDNAKFSAVANTDVKQDAWVEKEGAQSAGRGLPQKLVSTTNRGPHASDNNRQSTATIDSTQDNIQSHF